MSPLKLLPQVRIGDFLNLLPISRENLRKTDPCLGSFALQSDPSERHIGTGNPRKSAHSKIRPWAGSRKKSPKMRPWVGFLYLRGDTCRECPQ